MPLTNNFGVTFDVPDPEFWMYLGLPDEVAHAIAKAFPHYWYSIMGGSQSRFSQQQAAELARLHRIKVLPQLAKVSMPVPPFDDLHKYLPDCPELRGLSPHQRPLQQSVNIQDQSEATDEQLHTDNPFNAVYVCSMYEKLPDDPTAHSMHESTDTQDQPEAMDKPFHTTNPFEILYLWSTSEKPPDDPISLTNWRHLAIALANKLFSEENFAENARYDVASTPFRLRDRLPDGAVHQRGPRLAQQEPLETLFPYSTDSPIRWGPLCFRTDCVTRSHFCVSGMTRSGKTTLLRLLFQSLHSHPDLNARFVLYDSKPELLPFLFSPEYLQSVTSNEQLDSEFYLLNPFDNRCTPWHIAADADSPESARRIVEVLFPDESKTSDYFPRAARRVATAVMASLRRKAGDRWTFYDFVAALQPENTMAVLAEYPAAQQLYQQFLTGPHASAGDLAKTLAAMTGLTLPAAWSWHNSSRPPLSLREWVRLNAKTIVLADNHAYPESSHEINRLLLDLLSRYLLAAGKAAPARTFFYLDEFEHLGHIPVLPLLAKQGASLNVNLALCIHDLGMLTDVYQLAAEGLLGQCGFFAFLAVKNRATAEWASGIIGEQVVQIEQHSLRQPSNDRRSSSKDSMVSYHNLTRPVVLPDEIKYLPLADVENGLTGYFLSPHHGPYLGNLPANKVLPPPDAAMPTRSDGYYLWPAAAGVSEYEPRPPEYLEPPDDSFATLHKLGFQRPPYPLAQSPDPVTPGGLLDINFDFDFGDD